MSVVDFKQAREERQPHWAGTAYCVGCHHEWEAVAPMGTLHLECPSCGLPKGLPKHPFGGADGDAVLTCTDCNGEALTMYIRNGQTWVKCMGCGADLTDAAFD